MLEVPGVPGSQFSLPVVLVNLVVLAPKGSDVQLTWLVLMEGLVLLVPEGPGRW